MDSIGLPPPEIHHFFIFREPQLILGHKNQPLFSTITLTNNQLWNIQQIVSIIVRVNVKILPLTLTITLTQSFNQSG